PARCTREPRAKASRGGNDSKLTASRRVGKTIHGKFLVAPRVSALCGRWYGRECRDGDSTSDAASQAAAAPVPLGGEAGFHRERERLARGPKGVRHADAGRRHARLDN